MVRVVHQQNFSFSCSRILTLNFFHRLVLATEHRNLARLQCPIFILVCLKCGWSNHGRLSYLFASFRL